MAVDSVQTNTQVDMNGNSYTSSVSNDNLTNEDFLNLMIQELKMQDPTKPMDSDRMMDNQLKMSTIESNLTMSESMLKLQSSFETSALASAANMIGRVADMSVEHTDEETGETEIIIKEYKIASILKEESEMYGYVNEVLGIKDNVLYEGTPINYSESGFIYDENGEQVEGIRLKMDESGRVEFNGYSPVLLNNSGEVIEDEEITGKFANAGASFVYGEEELLPLSSITKLR